ncbi:MAG: hypothetical protein K8I29_19625 [Alphaproteobacteria bacterium]|uniref:Uncharacterized protein n=1 Tax=Candidatus Nitrobium versatile TaxID=2884831 RepID=A0A953SIF2_9BACT|nr:hypothetical protein [Candidatus Nitrobium versatile]
MKVSFWRYHAHQKGTDRILETVQEAAERARCAWLEFLDLPPRQMADGSLMARTK